MEKVEGLERIEAKALEKFNSSNIGLDTLKTELQYILAGGYIDGKANQERERIEAEIAEERSRLLLKKEEVEKYHKEINLLKSGKADGSATEIHGKVQSFNPTFFNLFLSVWVICTVVLIGFYVPMSWKAWVATAADLARLLAGGLGGGTFPSSFEIQMAVQNSYYPVLFPFVMFIFGVVLHYFLIIPKMWLKVSLSAMIIGTIFFIDFSMAIAIHTKTNVAAEYAGFPGDGAWASSPAFYLILACGFVVAAMWSVLLHVCLVEWDKRSPVRQLEALLKQLNRDVITIQEHIDALESKKKMTPNVTVSSVELFEQVKDFKKGWFDGYNNLKKSYEQCFGSFIEEHFNLTTTKITEKNN